MTPLLLAIRAIRPDVIGLLVEQFNADVELVVDDGQTAVFEAVYTGYVPVIKKLLEYGACANHRDWCDQTPLCVAVAMRRPVMVDLLICYGADVNIMAHSSAREHRYFNVWYGTSPLAAALLQYFRFLNNVLPNDYTPAERDARLNDHRDIIKLLVPHCSSFEFMVHKTSFIDEESDNTLSCVAFCFMVESQHCDDLHVTKHLLRNGATADFGAFYEAVKDNHGCRADLVTASFVKLCLLSGCTFSEYFARIKHEKEQGPAGQDHLAKHVHALVENVFSQPLTLQEMSIMAIRKSIGSRQLWAKIDALPVGIPAHVKDMIHLKLY